MKNLLEKLFENYTLTHDEAFRFIEAIARDELNEYQLTAFITVLNMRSITLDELQGFKEALLQNAIPISLPKDSLDIVGTGGDGKDTFNISTLSSFVVAAMGEQVVKHGSYSASSVSGSSDMLEHFGYYFNSDSAILQHFLDETGICFLHAPILHPVMKKVAGIRRNLGVKTFFNLLGPLVNPVQPNNQLLGTYNAEVARIYHYLAERENRNLGVVCSLDGYDEVSLTDDALCYTQEGKYILSPNDFGLNAIRQNEIKGGTSKSDNSKLFLNILEGNGTEAQCSVVYANAGLAYNLMHPSRSLQDCVGLAKEALDSKKALGVFNKLMKLSREYS